MAINPRDRGEFAASMGVMAPAHSNIPPMPQIDRWWVGGAVQGPSEYGAQYKFKKSEVTSGEVGSARYLSPTLLQQPTLAHFSNAGYAKRARSASRAIFPSWRDTWTSETKRSFPPIPLKKESTFGSRDFTTFWNDLNMYTKAWGFPRQETWVCPSYLREETMRDAKIFHKDGRGRIVPLDSLIPDRLQTEFQAAYKGAQPRQRKMEPHAVREINQTCLAPDMYSTSYDMIGSKVPRTF